MLLIENIYVPAPPPGYELKPQTLPDLVPTLVYVTLAPFLEAEEAYEVAVG